MNNTNKEKPMQNENQEYLGRIFAMLKRMENIAVLNRSATLNASEMRLISELMFSEYEGRRMISTQLAKKLDITRSAVSQIVKKLEAEGVIRRVPDENDKKIAYVELTKKAVSVYENVRIEGENFIADIKKEFGKKKLDTFLTLSEEFLSIMAKYNKIK